jgi:hypothetical protein
MVKVFVHDYIWNEATRRAAQNVRQRRSRAHQKYVLQNAMQNVIHNIMPNVIQNVMPNGEQSLPTAAINLVLKNLTLNLERSITRSAKRFTIEWFKVTFSRGMEY